LPDSADGIEDDAIDARIGRERNADAEVKERHTNAVDTSEWDGGEQLDKAEEKNPACNTRGLESRSIPFM